MCLRAPLGLRIVCVLRAFVILRFMFLSFSIFSRNTDFVSDLFWDTDYRSSDETFGGLNSDAIVQLLSTNNWLVLMNKLFFAQRKSMFLD